MILLIDLGNTRLKWAWWQAGRLRDGGAVQHREQDLAIELKKGWQDMPEPSAVHIASVAQPALRAALVAVLAERGSCPVHFAVSQPDQAGVRNSYPDPALLGVDRWLAMIAAWQRVKGAVCVVDCGSALTLDILDHHGRHLGGVIAPGLRLMSEALQHGTALPTLNAVSLMPLGHDTQTAMAAGTTQALLGLIDRCRQQAPVNARLLLTGGDADLIAAGITGPYELIPDLVLEGLGATLDGV